MTISGEADAPLPLRPTDLVVPHGTIALNWNSADQKQLVKHPIVTKAKLAASTLMALCLVCRLNITMAIKSCSVCLILCTLMGVMVLALMGNRKMEICCGESPTEMLWTDYHSVANFWKSSREMFSTEITCSALNEGLVMDLLVNPSCNPSLAVLWALVTLTMLTKRCCGLTLCRSCHENFRMIVAIGRIGCRCWKGTKRKTSYTRARAKETIKDKRERLRTRAQYITASQTVAIEDKSEFTASSIKLLHSLHDGTRDALMTQDEQKETIEG